MAAESFMVQDLSGLTHTFAGAPKTEIVANDASCANFIVETHCTLGRALNSFDYLVVVVPCHGQASLVDIKQFPHVLGLTTLRAFPILVASIAVIRALRAPR